MIAQIDTVARDVGLRPGQLVITDEIDVRTLEDRLAALATECELIHVGGDQTWFDDLDDPRWEDLNLRREAFFKRAPVKLLFWLTPRRVAERPVRRRTSGPGAEAWTILRSASRMRECLCGRPLSSAPTTDRPRWRPGCCIAELRGALDATLPDEEVRLPLLDEALLGRTSRHRAPRRELNLRIRLEEELTGLRAAG